MFDLKAVKAANDAVEVAEAALEGAVAVAVSTYLKVKVGDRIMGSCGYDSKPVKFQVQNISAKADGNSIAVTLSGPVVNRDGSLAAVKRGYEFVSINDGASAPRFMSPANNELGVSDD